MEVKNLITIVYIQSSDRIIYIEKDMEENIIGLNYTQGDDMKEFKKCYMKNMPKLLNFFNKFKNTIKISEYLNDIQIVDIMIWTFVELEEFFQIER